MPKPVEEEVDRQLKKLERMHPDAAETATLRNWLDIMIELPWSKASRDNLDLQKAQEILNEDHYGLEKVKERIIEALAVRKLKEKPKGPILCLVGPPGVGKTSSRPVDRARAESQVRAIVSGRRSRRGRDSRPSPHLRRRDAGPDHSGHSAGRHEQSADHARRDRQGRAPTSAAIRHRRCSKCSIRNRTSRFATTTSACRSICRTSCS